MLCNGTLGTVYLIDDEEEILSALSWLLKAASYDVKTFKCAQDFLRTSFSETNGCIVTDLCMPEMDGIAFLRQIKLKKIYMPVIVLTGKGDIPVAVEAMKEGAVDFITKPFIQETFLIQISQAIAKYAKQGKSKEFKNFKENLHVMSSKQKLIINLMLEGKTNKQIAEELRNSISTVEYHRSKLLKQFGVKNLLELVKCMGSQ